MKLPETFNNMKIHLLATAVFVVLSYLYFYPVLEGKVLKANDSTVAKVYSKEIQDYRAKYGKEPLWTNALFSGMPAYLISIKYPGNLFKKVDNILRIFRMPVSVLFLSMLGFYILLLVFKVDPWLAMAGAFAYGFTSFFFQVLGAGHNTQAVALAYMPMVIGGIYYAYRYDAFKGALITAFFLTLELIANHFQITYYAMLCLLIFVITELIYSFRNRTVARFIKTSIILIIPFILAAGVNFASLYTTTEYGKYSTRGKSDLVIEDRNNTSGLDREYITAWSYGVDETFNMLIPNYKGGSSEPFDRNTETVKVLRQNNVPADAARMYWGTQGGTDGPHYVGAIIFFLFILGLFIIKGQEKWWLLAATILSIMLSWGKNFMPLTDLFIDYFPGYNKFRAVTMILIIAEFCIPLLAILALRDIFNGTLKRSEIIGKLKIAAGITGGFILLVLIIPGIAGSFLSPYEAGYPEWLRSALISDRKMLLKTDSFRSLIFILLAAAAILAFLYEKLKSRNAVLIIGALILLDLWTVDKRYLDADRFDRPSNYNKIFTPTVADAAILQDKSYYRVANLTVSPFNDNSPTSYFHKSIGGYHGAKIERYQEFIDSSLKRDIQAFSKATTIEQVETMFNYTPALNMLNTKYIIWNPEAPPLPNGKALGNAWFVEKPVIVANANEEIGALDAFDPSGEALIDKKFEDQITKTAYPKADNESIELVSYEPNELKYKFSAQSEKLVVFSEIYYPAGWKSYIDGVEAKHFRTNYILRGMVVPAGDHEIRFYFEPSSYVIGNKVSLASSIFLILLIAGYIGAEFLKRRNKE